MRANRPRMASCMTKKENQAAAMIPVAVASLMSPDILATPAITWTEQTTALFLEFVFSICPAPSAEQCTRISSQCGKTEEEVVEWFSTRRCKWMLEGLSYQGLTMSVLTTVEPPFEVIWASEEWLHFCGFREDEIIGQTLKLIQGAGTDQAAIDQLMDSVRRAEVFTATLLNYTKRGVPFYHKLTIEPLTDTQGKAQLFKASSESIVTCWPNPPVQQQQQQRLSVAAEQLPIASASPPVPPHLPAQMGT